MKKLFGSPIVVERVGWVNAFRLKLARWWSGSSPITIRFGNRKIVVRPNTPDVAIAASSLGDEYEPLKKIFDSEYDGLIIDAGGYIGTAAIKLSDFYPKARIVTVEPSTENYNVLLRNIRNYPRISAIKAALVPKNKPGVFLSNRGTGQWGYTIVEKPLDNAQAVPVENVLTITLSDICSEFKAQEIGILKLDIEGAEKELLTQGAKELERTYAVFAELHDRITHGCTEAFMKFSEKRALQIFDGEKYLSIRKIG